MPCVTAENAGMLDTMKPLEQTLDESAANLLDGNVGPSEIDYDEAPDKSMEGIQNSVSMGPSKM